MDKAIVLMSVWVLLSPPRKIGIVFVNVWICVRSMEKTAWDGPQWGQEGLFLANPDLADILGDIDCDFKNFHV